MILALSSLETTALIRDIMLIIFLVLGILGLVLALVLGLTFYRKIKDLVERVDAGVDRVEAMVDKVDSTTDNVKRTATYMNRGMRAGDLARSAVGVVFGRGNDDSSREKDKSKKKD